MSTFDVAVQVKALLAAAVWPSGSVAFGKVFVSAGVDFDRLGGLRMPFAMITPGSLVVDEETEDLTEQDLTITIAQKVAGDPYGETVLMGGMSDGTGLTSEGRGLLELEQILFDALALLADDDSVTIQFVGADGAEATLDDDHGYIGYRPYRYKAWAGAGSSP